MRRNHYPFYLIKVFAVPDQVKTRNDDRIKTGDEL